jgi:hypothetical protein
VTASLDGAPPQEVPSWWATLNAIADGGHALRRHRALDPAGLREVAILGAAVEGQRLAALCRTRGIRIVAISDDNPAKIGTSSLGHPVVAMRELATLDRAAPIVIVSHRVLGAAEQLSRVDFTAVTPFAVLQALDPERFLPHMFYEGLLEDTGEHRDHDR